MVERPEIISLEGIPYYATPADGDELSKLQNDLTQALATLHDDPDSLEAHVMYGRALAYLWRYHEAITVYSHALNRFGADSGLYRHRGHRLISIRRFEAAAVDLGMAFKMDPDDFDICYHLGLARWLLGDWVGAKETYASVFPNCKTPDEKVAVGYWYYMTLRRLGHDADAKALLDDLGTPEGVDENVHYLDLLCLFQGVIEEEDILVLAEEQGPLAASTLQFGLGCWHLLGGRTERAAELYRKAASGSYWPAFGFVAAEAELVRLSSILA